MAEPDPIQEPAQAPATQEPSYEPATGTQQPAVGTQQADVPPLNVRGGDPPGTRPSVEEDPIYEETAQNAPNHLPVVPNDALAPDQPADPPRQGIRTGGYPIEAQTRVPPVRVDNRTRRSDEDALEGLFCKIVDGDYAGRIGVFDSVLEYDRDTGYPAAVLVTTRDEKAETLAVGYDQIRPIHDTYHGGR